MNTGEIISRIQDAEKKLGSSLYSLGNSMKITLKKASSGISISVEEDTAHHRKRLSQGISEKKFQEQLQEFLNEKIDTNSLSVGCMVSSVKEKSCYKVTYFVIPVTGYEIQQDGVHFDRAMFTLSKEEYQIALETKMAFLDDKDNTLYPIRVSALKALGQYMDATASYKEVADIPLGNAMLLAEKMANNAKSLKIGFQKYSPDFCPVIMVGRPKTAFNSMSVIFSDFFENMAGIGMFKVKSWEITEESVNVTLTMLMEDYDISMLSSNLPGESNRIIITKNIADKAIVFAEKSAYSTNNFSVKKLITEALVEYQENIRQYHILSENTEEINFSLLPEEEKLFLLCLGQKRYAKVEPRFTGTKLDSVKNLIAQTYDKLPPKQEKMLNEVYRNIIHRLAS